MASKSLLKANYTAEATYDAYFTGQHVQITNDGSAVLCDCGDSVGVVSLDTGRVTGRIEIEEDVIVCLSLSPDNSTIAVALKSQSVQLYQWPSLALLRTFRSYHLGPVATICWDRSSSLLATGGADSVARVWDLKGKYCTHSLKGASGVFGYIMFDRDLMTQPRVYGAVSSDIFVWELAAGSSKVVGKLEGHHSTVTSLAMTEDRSSLVSVGLDRVIILWDLATMASKKIVPVLQSLSGLVLQPKEGSLFPGASTDDNHIYALIVGDKGIPAVWQVDAGKEVWRSSAPIVTPPPGTEGGVTLVRQVLPVASMDSVLMTTYDHSIVLLKSKTLDVWKQLAGYNEQIFDAIFVGQGDSHLVIATNSPQLRIYDSTSLNCSLIFGHTAIILALSRHPTHPRIFASSAHDMSVRLWLLKDDGTAVCIATANGHTASVGSVALGPGFMVSGSRDTCLKRWGITDIEAHPLVTGKGEGVVTTVTASHTERAHDKDINGVSISINGRYIASASQDKTAKIWDGKTLRLLGVLNGHRRGLWCVQFSPTDEVVATASADTTIKIWTLSDFSNAVTLEGHETGVLRLAWVSRGQQMLSTSSDGLLKLWTVKSRVCTASLDNHDDRTWALAVSGVDSEGNDGAVLFTGGEDAKLVRWKDVTQEELDKATEEAARLASMEQTLSNLLNDKKWAKALRISLRLDQPFRSLKIVRALLDESPDKLSAVLQRLPSEERDVILRYSVQWNTKTRSCREAQIIVNTLLHDLSPEDFEKSESWRTTLEGLLPYTERHMNRLSALHQSSAILKYLANSLSLAAPLDNNDFGRSIQEASPEMETEDERAIQPISVEDLDLNFTIERVMAESSDDDDGEDEEGDEDDHEDEDEEEEEAMADEDEDEEEEEAMADEDEEAMADKNEEEEEDAMETQNRETEISTKKQAEYTQNDSSMEISNIKDKIGKEIKELRDMKVSRKKGMEKKIKKTQILLKV